jgi:hypothetical protein
MRDVVARCGQDWQHHPARLYVFGAVVGESEGLGKPTAFLCGVSTRLVAIMMPMLSWSARCIDTRS